MGPVGVTTVNASMADVTVRKMKLQSLPHPLLFLKCLETGTVIVPILTKPEELSSREGSVAKRKEISSSLTLSSSSALFLWEATTRQATECQKFVVSGVVKSPFDTFPLWPRSVVRSPGQNSLSAISGWLGAFSSPAELSPSSPN